MISDEPAEKDVTATRYYITVLLSILGLKLLMAPFTHCGKDGVDYYLSAGLFFAGHRFVLQRDGAFFMVPEDIFRGKVAFVPLFPLIFSLFFRVSTSWEVIWIATWTIPIVSAFAHLVMYRLLSEMFDERTGIAGGLFLGLNYNFWYFSQSVHTDAPGATLSLLAAYLFWRAVRNNRKLLYLCGLVTALACMTRMTSLFLVLFFCAFLLFKRQFNILFSKEFVLSLLVAILPLLFWSAYTLAYFDYNPIIQGVRTLSMAGLRGSLAFYFGRIHFLLSMPGAIFLIIGLVATLPRLIVEEGPENLTFLILFSLSALVVLSLGWVREWYVPYFIVPLVPFIALGVSSLGKLSERLHLVLMCILVAFSSQIHPALLVDISLSDPYFSWLPLEKIIDGSAIIKIIWWSSVVGNSDYDIEHTFKLLENAVK